MQRFTASHVASARQLAALLWCMSPTIAQASSKRSAVNTENGLQPSARSARARVHMSAGDCALTTDGAASGSAADGSSG
jgi:hypothetical protein